MNDDLIQALQLVREVLYGLADTAPSVALSLAEPTLSIAAVLRRLPLLTDEHQALASVRSVARVLAGDLALLLREQSRVIPPARLASARRCLATLRELALLTSETRHSGASRPALFVVPRS